MTITTVVAIVDTLVVVAIVDIVAVVTILAIVAVIAVIAGKFLCHMRKALPPI